MTMWYDQLLRDIRLTSRRAARQATFTAVAVLCLALGIGATLAAFSVLEPVLLDRQPFERPDELHTIAAYDISRTNLEERYWMSWYPTRDIRENSETLDGLAAFYQREFDVIDDGSAERVAGAETVAGSFDLLGVRPLLGRTIRDDDVREGRRTALISESYWSRRYGADPSAIGRALVLKGEPYEIVGVLPAGIRFPNRAEIWASYMPDDYTYREHLGMGVLLVVGRLPAGQSAADLELDLERTLARIQSVEPVFYGEWGLETLPLQEYLTGDFRGPLWALFTAAVLVLLLATANVTNLMLVRSQRDVRSRAVRTALGAGCRRLAQQSLVENVMIAGLGAALGAVIATWSVPLLLAVAPPNNPAFDDVGISIPVLALMAALALSVAVVMSTVPALRCHDSLEALRGHGSASWTRKERRMQTGFVVAQVALSLVLLVGAGLVSKSFFNLRALDLGFDTEQLTVLRASAPASLSTDVDARADFSRDVVERLAAIPGVTAAGAVSWVPFEDGDVGYNHSIEDFPPENAGDRYLAPGRIVSPGYFQAMGIPILSGRDFRDSDRMDAPPVGIVSREFERRYWPTGSALGKRIKRGTYGMDNPWIEIVGVVGDIRSNTLSQPIQPGLFYPIGQTRGAFLSQMAYVMKSTMEAESILATARSVIADLSPASTTYGASTGDAIERLALGRASFNGIVIGAFALMGLTLAAAGTYGLTSYTVSSRTREFGLRSALGARPGQVRGLVLRGALGTAIAGIAIGLGGAWALTRGLDELLFEVGAGDWGVYAVVSGLLAGTVLLSSALPARRATRVPPTVALKGD